MDIRAILLVGGRSPLGATFASDEERIAGVPLALCDVLGASVLERALARIKQAGVSSVAVLLDSQTRYPQMLQTQSRTDVTYYYASACGDMWTAAMAQFESFSRSADLVLVQRFGPFAEIEYESLMQYHLDRRNRVTAVVASDGTALDCVVLNCSRRSDAAYLFRSQMKASSTPCFASRGYWNPMRTWRDFRAIAMDAFACKNSIRPVGAEIKPGVWVGKGARIHHAARVLAPTYIGARSRIHGSAVLTRGAVVEHHCEVDCGSVLEAATMLPYTYVGVGLEFVNSVVGFSEIAHLGHGVTIKIDEASFVSVRKASAFARTVESTWALLSYLPAEFVRGVLRGSGRSVPRDLADTTDTSVTGLDSARNGQQETTIPAMTAELISVRRYGNE